MADDRIVISSEPGLTPDEIGRRSFPVVFRGYDQDQVRRFLKKIGDELVAAREREQEVRRALEEARSTLAHPELDEATLTALYGSASVLAFPSLYEGFGLPLLEAMARGVPAVIGRAGSLPELAGGAAETVDPEDVTSIAAGVERLLADRGLRESLGAAGKRRAAGFTWARAAARTRDVLRRIGARAGSATSRTMA